MSQINEILERLKIIQETMSLGGVTCKAYAYVPADPSSAACPFWINEPHGGSVKIMAITGRQEVVTNIRMYLCIARQEGDATLQAALKSVASWRDVAIATLAGKLRLGNDLSYILVAPITAWDIVTYAIGTTKYLALFFNLQVTEAYPITLAA